MPAVETLLLRSACSRARRRRLLAGQQAGRRGSARRRPRPAPAAALLVAALAALACDDQGRRELVAKAGPWTLSEDRLAELLVLAQPFPLDPGPASALARHWLGAASLALRAAAGDSLLGAEALAASTWLDRREALLAADREDRLGAQAALAPETADSVFRAGSLLLVAHVLRRVGPETSPAERELQRRTAEGVVRSLIDGEPWSEAAAASEDPDSRDASGLLGLVAKGDLPAGLDAAAFQLQPGQISGVVESRAGFHVLYRPRLDEARTLFAARLRERRLAEADAEANERARAERRVRTAPGAVERLGRIAAAPADWLDSQAPMAEWEGGRMAASVVARYAVFLPVEARTELAAAGESARAGFVRDLAVRELRLSDLRARGASLDPELEDAMAAAHAAEVERWSRALETDAAGAPSRDALARHMEAVAARRGQAPSLSLSPLFEAWLLDRAGAELRERGVRAAVAKARRMLEEAGS